MILPEERILQSQDPVPEDLNDWPDFTLTDAQVRVPGSSVHANLLEAKPNYPLSITGKLACLDSQRAKLVIHPKYTQIELRIDDCTQYAFGQDPSGKSLIWAAGKAGWFEIIPSPRYAAVYDDIVKAIDLIYFLSDVHQEFARRRPIRGAKVDELLALYQQHTDYRIDENAEVEAIFEKHHSFLIRQMLEGWEGISWARTHLWGYFSRLYPDEVAPESEPRSADESQEEDLESSDRRSSSPESLLSDEANSQDNWTDAIFEVISNLRACGHLDRRRCSVDGVAKALVKHYNVASKHEAGGIIKNAADSLLPRLDADLSPSGNNFWSGRALYRQLQKLADIRQDIQEEESNNDAATPVNSHPNRRHQKSILRPSTGAGKGKKRTLAAQTPSDEDRVEEAYTEDGTELLMSLDTPTKRRRRGYIPKNSRLQNLENGAAVSAFPSGATCGPLQEQLDLIRRESIANGRQHINHLEALVESLDQGRQ